MIASGIATGRFFLVGFMGAGKTTLGRRVARRMKVPFVDLDVRIERASGKSVVEIFSLEGEEAFRRRESQALKDIVAGGSLGVIATGGGAFTREENRRLMKEAGVVVWLDVPTEEILPRIKDEARPLWGGGDDVHRLHAQRRASYEEADARLDLSNAGPRQAAERLYRLLIELRNIP